MNKYNYKQYPITFGLMAGCILIYIYTSLKFSFDMNAQEGVQAGGFLPLAILYSHDYYRFLSANFIHFGIIHLAMNMLSLSNIGPLIERIFGTLRYVGLILGSALGTTVLPYIYYRIFKSPTDVMGLTVSGGASGIILGLLGGLCFLSWKYRGIYKRVFQSIVPSLVMVALMSLLIPTVSLSGHLGGFVGGFITTMMISIIYPKSSWQPIQYFMN